MYSNSVKKPSQSANQECTFSIQSCLTKFLLNFSTHFKTLFVSVNTFLFCFVSCRIASHIRKMNRCWKFRHLNFLRKNRKELNEFTPKSIFHNTFLPFPIQNELIPLIQIRLNYILLVPPSTSTTNIEEGTLQCRIINSVGKYVGSQGKERNIKNKMLRFLVALLT